VKVYLAGPMRGHLEFNFPAFHAAAKLLRELGYEVHSPAEVDVNNGFDPTGMAGDNAELGPAGFDLTEALLGDLTYILKEAEAVVLLPGWRESNGALAECWTALAVGKLVLSLNEAMAAGAVARDRVANG
jgi:Domain of unknown function (DUF4406)